MTATNAYGFSAVKYLEVNISSKNQDTETEESSFREVVSEAADKAENAPPIIRGIPSTFFVDATVVKQTGLLINPGNFIYNSE
jgi:hypothetical protein